MHPRNAIVFANVSTSYGSVTAVRSVDLDLDLDAGRTVTGAALGGCAIAAYRRATLTA